MYNTRRNACPPASPRPLLIATHGPAHRVAAYPTILSRSRPVTRASSATGNSPSRMGRHEDAARPISKPTRREAVAPSTLSRFGLAFLTLRRSAAAFYHNYGLRAQRAGRLPTQRRRQQRLVRKRCTRPADIPTSPHRFAPCWFHSWPRAPCGGLPNDSIAISTGQASELGHRKLSLENGPPRRRSPADLGTHHVRGGRPIHPFRFGLAFLTPRRSAAACYHNGGPRAQRAGRFQSPRRRQQRLVRLAARQLSARRAPSG